MQYLCSTPTIKVYTSVISWLRHSKIVVVYRINIKKIALLSKYLWTCLYIVWPLCLKVFKNPPHSLTHVYVSLYNRTECMRVHTWLIGVLLWEHYVLCWMLKATLRCMFRKCVCLLRFIFLISSVADSTKTKHNNVELACKHSDSIWAMYYMSKFISIHVQHLEVRSGQVRSGQEDTPTLWLSESFKKKK